MSLLLEIEPLTQSALTELRAAADSASLDQARVKFLGSNGAFTALMKQLGGLPKEDRPAAGKQINDAKAKIEQVLGERRSELELKTALVVRNEFLAATPPQYEKAASATGVTAFSNLRAASVHLGIPFEASLPVIERLRQSL